MRLHNDAITCQTSDTLQEVAAILIDTKVRHVYVLDNARLTGVISYHDILKSVVEDDISVSAGEIMVRVASVRENEVEKAYAIMRNFGTLICPVTSQERLIGYYSFADVCEELHRKVVGNGTD